MRFTACASANRRLPIPGSVASRVRDLHRGAPPDGDVLDLEHAAGRPLAQLPDEAIRPDCPSWLQLHRLKS